jgi:hypothetical protein
LRNGSLRGSMEETRGREKEVGRERGFADT